MFHKLSKRARDVLFNLYDGVVLAMPGHLMGCLLGVCELYISKGLCNLFVMIL